MSPLLVTLREVEAVTAGLRAYPGILVGGSGAGETQTYQVGQPLGRARDNAIADIRPSAVRPSHTNQRQANIKRI